VGNLILTCLFEKGKYETDVSEIKIISHYSPQFTASIVSFKKEEKELKIKYSITDFGSNKQEFDQWKFEILDENGSSLGSL
jgi:hypothetical protein